MASYEDNEYKFVAVLNSKVEVSRLMNALGHMTAGLVSCSNNLEEFRFLKYVDGDNGLHPAISHYPFIVLKAKNGNQIKTLREKAIEMEILHNDFLGQMIGTSAESQLAQVKDTKGEHLDYWGICLFGKQDALSPITKRFSVYR